MKKERRQTTNMETFRISEKDKTDLKTNETFETGTSSTVETNSTGPQPYGKYTQQ